MTKPLIALVTRGSDADETRWLQHLRQAMPAEDVRSLRGMSQGDCARVDVAIVANPEPADLTRLPNLVWVHSLWAGVERLVAELGDFRCPVVRLTDPELGRTMAEAALAWTYYLHRDMPAYAAAQREIRWAPRDYLRPDQVRVGLLGLGALGARAAERLTGAGFQVSGWARRPRDLPGVSCHSGPDGLRDLLAESDIVICLLPLTEGTRGLIGADQLAAMKPGAQLINFARGPILRDEALLEALDRGHLKHAVLDVFATEPLPADNRFWTHPRVTVLPHISAATDRGTASALVAQNVGRWREDGVIPQAVDFTLGY